MKTPEASLCFLLRADTILLVYGEYREGTKNWNGISAYKKGEEDIRQTAVRALYNEVKVEAISEALQQVAVLHLFEKTDEGHISETLKITVFLCEQWRGEPTHTAGLQPQWFPLETIPYDKMFTDSRHWLPRIIEGEQLIVEILQEKDPTTQLREVKDVLVRNIFD